MSAPLSPAVLPACADLVSAASLSQGSFRPHLPEMAEIGRKPGEVESPGAETGRRDCDSQVIGSARLVVEAQVGQYASPDQNVAEVFDQPPPGGGQKPPRLPAAIQDGLALIDDARPPRNLGGRPRTIDDVAKIKIATLLATGVSLR